MLMARSESETDPIRFCRKSGPVLDINALSRQDPFGLNEARSDPFPAKDTVRTMSGISEAVQAGRVLLARYADIE